MSNNNKTILIAINVDWPFLMHRLFIANALKKEGWRVIIAAKNTGKSSQIINLGFEFINLDISRFSINPFKEFKTVLKIYKLYKKINPAIVYQVTLKPVIYGGLVTRLLNIKTINTICGLGYNFSRKRKGRVQSIMIHLLKWGHHIENNHIFFENNDDLNKFYDLGILKQNSLKTVVNGVGVDLSVFKPQVIKSIEDKIIILLPSRMLWDKGIKEFVDAALLLKEKHEGRAFFKLYGMVDKDNKETIPKEYLENIFVRGYLEWFGFETNMIEVYSSSDIVVLPSYREGMPTVLLEAAAMAKPLITTDAVGCRNCVDEGVNGFKVPVKSVNELAAAIEKLIIDADLRIKMGRASRVKAEKEFDQKEIVRSYLEAFNSLNK